MSTTNQRTLPKLLAFNGKKSSADNAEQGYCDALTLIKLKHERKFRIRMASAIALSAAIHLGVLYGFNDKPVVAQVAPQRQVLQIETITMPPEEQEEREEVIEETLVNQAIDTLPPMQQELLSVPVDVDFIMAPAPQIDSNLSMDAKLLKIPSSTGRIAGAPTTHVFNLADLDRRPEILSSISPTYPSELQNTGMRGLVVIGFVVDAQGRVTNPEIISSPHPAFSSAVIRAVLKWRFKAGMKAGRTVSSLMELPVEFSMEQ